MRKYLFLLALSTAFVTGAYADNASTQRTINVQGQGEVKLAPNMATLQVAVETNAPDAKTAVQTNADKMNKVVATLKQNLGAEDKVSTSRYNLVPTYEYDKDSRRSTLSGYQVTNYVTVSTQKLDQLGSLLDAATQAGANRVENLQFSHDKWHTYEQQALSQAVLDAQLTATVLAKAAHVTLGELITLQPSFSGTMPMQEFSLAKTSTMSSTPIEPGDLVINMTISASYAIQ